MFPSADVDNNDEETVNQQWLHSKTYSELTAYKLQATDESVYKPTLHETAVKKSIKSRSLPIAEPLATKPSSKSIFLEDVPGCRQDDAYCIDRSRNKEIYTFGSIYEKQVAKFKCKPSIRILGFSDLRLRDLVDSTATTRSKPKGIPKSRYFSKHSRSMLNHAATEILGSTTRFDSPSELGFIALKYVSNCPAPSHTSEETSATLTVCENLNRRVYDNPTDLSSWLELIDLQAKGAAFLHISNAKPAKGDSIFSQDYRIASSDRLTVIKKQLAIAERALTSNPGCISLKVLLIRMGELAAELESQGASSSTFQSGELLFQPERISREWAQLAFTFPQSVHVWRGYIAHLMGKYASLSTATRSVGSGLFARIDAVYKRALTSLSGILCGRILSHRPEPDTAEQTVDLLADYAHWLVQAGHAERALALWQAVIEFNCFRPTELKDAPNEQSVLEMELFWNSGAARFGQPGSQNWHGWFRTHRRGSHRGEPTTVIPSKKSRRQSSSSGLVNLEEVSAEHTPHQLQSKWKDLMCKLKSISTTCEDALIYCSTENILEDTYSKMDSSDVAPSVISSEDAVDQWVRRSAVVPSLAGHATIGKSRAVLRRRGKAWVGLERAREAVGWLPADVMKAFPEDDSMDQEGEEEEDPDRTVLFDDIKPCLLELCNWNQRQHSQSNQLELTQRMISLHQRMALHCLEFLGAYESEMAEAFRLPIDVRLVHDLAQIGPIQRQNLSPLMSQAFGAGGVLDGLGVKDRFAHLTAGHQDIWLNSRYCFRDAAIHQLTKLPHLNSISASSGSKAAAFKADWIGCLSHVRFRVGLDRLLDCIQAGEVTGKAIISSWRQFGRSVMASCEQNQRDLGLWMNYASGYWQASLQVESYLNPSNAIICSGLVEECRRILDTTLVSYPLPLEHSHPQTELTDRSLIEFYSQTLLPRYRLLHAYIDLELGVSSGSDGSHRTTTLGSEKRALDLLIYAANGGPYYAPSYSDIASNSHPRPSTLVKCSHAFGKRLESIWCLLVTLPEDSPQLDRATHGALLDAWACVVPIQAYLSFIFDLLTTDQQTAFKSLPSLVSILRRIDRLHNELLNSDPQSQRKTRWSPEDPVANSVEWEHWPMRVCSRYFLQLVLGGLAAFCGRRHRNRRQAIGEILQFWTHTFGPSGDDQVVLKMVPPDLLLPTQLIYLLPARIAINKRLFPFSLENAAACHGLLSPLLLTPFIQQLNTFVQQIALTTAHATVDQLMHHGPVWSALALPSLSSWDVIHNRHSTNPSSSCRQELAIYASSMPLVLDLFVLSLELERWTSLMAQSMSVEPKVPGDSTSSQRVRNAFERAVRSGPFMTPLQDEHGALHHVLLLSITPSFWTAYLRLVVWRAYMAFVWMLDTHSLRQTTESNLKPSADPRQRRQAVKAVFYRAVEDLPWAKVLYTDLVRYCPEDVEEVVDLLSERELRLRTPLEEVDLLLTAKPNAD